MDGTLTSNRGVIDIDNGKYLEVLVLSQAPEVESTYEYYKIVGVVGKLTDGRYAISSYQHKNRFLKFLIGPTSTKKLAKHAKFQGSIDAETKEKIKKELLTRRCGICKNPTEYTINFRQVPYGCFLDYNFYDYSACLEHFNEVIDRVKREKGRIDKWTGYKHTNILHFSGAESLGQVEYDKTLQDFVCV